MLLTRKRHVRNFTKFLTGALGKGRKGKNVYPVFENVKFMSSIISCFIHIILSLSLSLQTAKDSTELISRVICDYSRSRNRRARGGEGVLISGGERGWKIKYTVFYLRSSTYV